MATAIIYYTVFENIGAPIEEKHIHALPEPLSKEILLYKKQDDINRLTAGKYLLKKILEEGGSTGLLDKYQVDEMGKPFIPDISNFNISHSGQVVVCALLNAEGKIGIDVEKIRTVEIENFNKQFSPPEMMKILADHDPQQKFFDYWTMKEAVMKADGRGMRIPLHSIRLKVDHATIDDSDTHWHLYPITLHESVRSHVCSDIVLGGLELKHIHLTDLFHV
jgi:4'-phosphopantetheinyl transferase